MSQWLEPKRAYADVRSVSKIRTLLLKGSRPESEVTSCCSSCRAALKWMRQHGNAEKLTKVERLADGRVRLYRP